MNSHSVCIIKSSRTRLRISGKRMIHLPSFHSFGWSREISVVFEQDSRLLRSILAVRMMDLETKQKHNGWETLKTKTTANKKRAMVRNFKTEPHKNLEFEKQFAKITVTMNTTHYLNTLALHISMHILHTVLYTSKMLLTRRICLIIKNFFSWRSFSLFFWPWCVIRGLHCKENLDARHSWGWKA